MERHDLTMRAARYLLGAGTLAVAMLTVTARPAAAQAVCGEGLEQATICGIVYNDANTDGKFDTGNGDSLLGGVTLIVKDTSPMGAITLVDTGTCPNTNDYFLCGYYMFPSLPGTFDICVKDPTSSDASPKCDTTFTKTTVTLSTTNVPDANLHTPPEANVSSAPGTGTPGYWKNHKEAWPAAGIQVGNTTYTWATAAPIMGKVGGDKTITMFSALISAKLNAWAGNDFSCVAETIDNANDWMKLHPVGSKVTGSSAAWSGSENGDTMHQELDDYNNGKLCAPHRD